jgi:hypothetical protein
VGLTQQEMCGTDGYAAMCYSLLLWSLMVFGDPTPIANVGQHPFNLTSGEIPLILFVNVIYSVESVSRSYQGGYGGASVRVAHGVYYHFGGFKGERIDTATLKQIDGGGMLFTTKNLYFGGTHTTFRIPYEHVLSFRPYPDGIEVFRDNASSKPEVFTVVNARPSCGWFLFNLTHFLAQPETRALYGKPRKA